MNSKKIPIDIKNIFHVFAAMGNLTFGGGNATVAVLHRDIVGRLSWITDEEFILSFAISRLSPGSNYFAFCVSIGWLLKKFPGAVVSLLAASIPCSLIAALATAIFSFYIIKGFNYKLFWLGCITYRKRGIGYQTPCINRHSAQSSCCYFPQHTWTSCYLPCQHWLFC